MRYTSFKKKVGNYLTSASAAALLLTSATCKSGPCWLTLFPAWTVVLSVLALNDLLAQNQVAIIRILCHLFQFLERGHGMSLSRCAHCLWLDSPLRLGEGSLWRMCTQKGKVVVSPAPSSFPRFAPVLPPFLSPSAPALLSQVSLEMENSCFSLLCYLTFHIYSLMWFALIYDSGIFPLLWIISYLSQHDILNSSYMSCWFEY